MLGVHRSANLRRPVPIDPASPGTILKLEVARSLYLMPAFLENRRREETRKRIVISAKARIPMRLLVDVPREMRKHQLEIFARQCFANEEVGRITWRRAPTRNSR